MKVIVVLSMVVATVVVTSLIAHESEANKYFDSLLGLGGKLRFGGTFSGERISSKFHRSSSKPVAAHSGAGETSPDDDGETEEELNAQENTDKGVGEILVPTHVTKHDLKSKCFQRSGPKFSKLLAVHFYGPTTHSAATSGCGPHIEIELQVTNGELSLNPKLDTTIIKELLIDSDLFNPKAQTYLITHGFLANWKANGNSWQCNLKDLILNNIAANVFIVDWSGGSKPTLRLDYITSTSNTRYVGALLGELIRSLIELTGQPDASQYHMIGHSLGAHISGLAGYYLNGTLGHITALDPAGPCFKAKLDTAKTAVDDGYLADGSRRLSRQSARSVVALHTDASLFGLKQSCAHYDVYVNGGFKQPDCDLPRDDTDDDGGRITKMIKFWDKKLPCRHAYAYRLFNQFVHVRKLLEGRALSDVKIENNRDRCYLVAYQCSNWNSFKAGECGFCKDGDSRCVYIGVSEAAHQPAKVDDFIEDQRSSPLAIEEDDDDDDDEQFNGEADFDDDPEETQSSRQNKIDNYSRGKHFMKAGSSPLTCMFHYQIIVATKRQPSSQPKESGKHYYYLHLPLKLSGKLVDEQDSRLNDRLVQVSHKLRPGSPAYNYLKSEYIRSALGRHDSSEELDFYTALITFEPIAEADKCREADSTGRKNRWQICNPLDNIQEARLWASSGTRLDSVVWVGMNYMSGLNYEQRMSESYVFTRGQNEPIKARAEIHKSSQVNLAKVQPNKSDSLANIAGSVGKSLTYLLDAFEAKKDTDAWKKFKFDRICSELLYAINLQPTKLG